MQAILHQQIRPPNIRQTKYGRTKGWVRAKQQMENERKITRKVNSVMYHVNIGQLESVLFHTNKWNMMDR
jgi:hypothetical protein